MLQMISMKEMPIHLKLAVGRFKCASAYIHAYHL